MLVEREGTSVEQVNAAQKYSDSAETGVTSVPVLTNGWTNEGYGDANVVEAVDLIHVRRRQNKGPEKKQIRCRRK